MFIINIHVSMRRQRLMKPSQYHGVSFEFLWLNLISQYNFQIEWIPFIITAGQYNITIFPFYTTYTRAAAVRPRLGPESGNTTIVQRITDTSSSSSQVIFTRPKLCGFFYFKTSLLISGLNSNSYQKNCLHWSTLPTLAKIYLWDWYLLVNE